MAVKSSLLFSDIGKYDAVAWDNDYSLIFVLFKRWRHIYNFHSISILIPITCSLLVCKFLTHKDILIIFIILINLFIKFIWKWFLFYLPLEISMNSIAASAIVVSESISFPIDKI